jgi:hypothetical protein
MEWNCMNALAEWLGGLMGNALALVTLLIFWILAWLIAWGFWTDRILSKAGFTGGTWRLLFAMLNIPVLVGMPLWEVSNYEMQEIIGGASALSIWLALMAIAILPWPIRRKPPAAPTAARKPSP